MLSINNLLLIIISPEIRACLLRKYQCRLNFFCNFAAAGFTLIQIKKIPLMFSSEKWVPQMRYSKFLFLSSL